MGWWRFGEDWTAKKWRWGRQKSGVLIHFDPIWLVVWNMICMFPNSWDDDPIWRTHICQGLKPPTSISDIVQGQWSTSFLYLYLYILYEWIVRIIKKSGNAWTMRSFLSWTMTTVDDHPLFWSVDGMVKCSHGTHTGWETALWDRTGDKTCSSYLLVINVTVQSNKHERKEVPNRAM